MFGGSMLYAPGGYKALPRHLGTRAPAGAAPHAARELPASEACTGVVVYEAARTVHLERLARTRGVALLTRTYQYDFDGALAARLPVRRASRWSIARQLFRTPYTTVELPEPLYMSALPSTALYLAALWLAKRLTGRRVRIVTYAMENLSIAAQLPGMRRHHRLVGPLIAAVVRWSARQFDAIAFATGAAVSAYEASGVDATTLLRSAVFPPIEPRCAGCDVAEHRGETAIFLGAFEPRKGLPEVLAAWPEVLRRLPHARLKLVGKGPMLDELTAWSAGLPSVSLIVDPPRTTIHDELAAAHALLLPSQPTPRWREQIGLPILEALSHGCEIVTTDQTGIAGWLGAHGHGIVADTAAPARLADAIVAALLSARPASALFATLPATSGRVAAADWMWGRATSA